MPDQTFAKWFEGELHEQGQLLQSRCAAYWHRFPDAYAARGALPTQPGDFMLVGRPTWLIEAKSSEKHQSLKSCAASHIEPEQVGKHLLWARSNNPSVFLFMSSINQTIEVWDGAEVAEAREAGKRLDKKASRVTFIDYSKENIYSLLYQMLNYKLRVTNGQT